MFKSTYTQIVQDAIAECNRLEAMHEDLSLFGAPGECYHDIDKEHIERNRDFFGQHGWTDAEFDAETMRRGGPGLNHWLWENDVFAAIS